MRKYQDYRYYIEVERPRDKEVRILSFKRQLDEWDINSYIYYYEGCPGNCAIDLSFFDLSKKAKRWVLEILRGGNEFSKMEISCRDYLSSGEHSIEMGFYSYYYHKYTNTSAIDWKYFKKQRILHDMGDNDIKRINYIERYRDRYNCLKVFYDPKEADGTVLRLKARKVFRKGHRKNDYDTELFQGMVLTSKSLYDSIVSYIEMKEFTKDHKKLSKIIDKYSRTIKIGPSGETVLDYIYPDGNINWGKVEESNYKIYNLPGREKFYEIILSDHRHNRVCISIDRREILTPEQARKKGYVIPEYLKYEYQNEDELSDIEDRLYSDKNLGWDIRHLSDIDWYVDLGILDEPIKLFVDYEEYWDPVLEDTVERNSPSTIDEESFSTWGLIDNLYYWYPKKIAYRIAEKQWDSID